MGMRLNPMTGQWEDDGAGTPLANPAEIQQAFQQGPLPPTVAPPGMGGLPPQALQPPPMSPIVQGVPAAPPMVRDTTTTTREVPLPQERESMRRLQATDDEAVRIAGQQGEVTKLKAEQEEKATKQRAEARGEFEQQTTSTVDRTSGEVAKAKAVYETENKRLMEAESPKDWWQTQETGTKAAAIISLALGAFGGALSGRGGNQAMDQLDKMIEHDYRLQQAKIAMQERKVAGAKEGVGMARQSSADERADLELKQAAKWERVGTYVAEQAAQVGTQNAATQAAAFSNAAEAKKQEHLQRWFESLRSKVTSTSVSGTGGAGSKSMNNDTLVYGPGGQAIAQARTPKEAEKANAANAAFRQLDGTLEALHKSYSEHGVSYNPLSDEFQNQKALKGAATIAYKNAAQLGALSGPDMGLVENAIGGAWVGKQGAAKLEAARNTLASSHVSALDSQGLPGKQIVNTLRQQQGPAATPLGGEKPAGGSRQPMSAQDAAAVSWARSHPGDPRAKEILQLHGL